MARQTPLRFIPDRERWHELGRHALIMSAFNVVIALGLWLVKGGELTTQLVYSFGIGTSIWLLIDFGRFLFPLDPVTCWPRGPWLWVLLSIAIGLGYVIGISLGDAYSGRSSFGLWSADPRRFLGFLLTGLAISGGVTFFFFTQGRAIAQRRLIEQAQRNAAETRLKLLESQLEPHMLFNTLANLRVLMGLDPARAQAMLDHLIAFLRATLSASRGSLHPLSAEFERLRDYLALMQIRMGERLRFELVLPAELADLPVPALLLQPLVENAIKHGLEPKVAGGWLRVTAQCVAGQLQLQVRDTGLGLGALQQAQEPGTAVGLNLVRERLATLYGPTARLQLQAADDAEGGTLVSIEMPRPIPH